jgi:hypothetical protein
MALCGVRGRLEPERRMGDVLRMGLITLALESFFMRYSSSSVNTEASKGGGRKKQTDAFTPRADSTEWTNSTTANFAIDREASIVHFPPT